MNALLKYDSIPPNLGYYGSIDKKYDNFMNINFSGMASGTDSLSQALANVPVVNSAAGTSTATPFFGNVSNLPQALSQGSTPTQSLEQRFKELAKLKEQGIITDAEYTDTKKAYTTQFKGSFGIVSPEQQAPQDPSASLSGKVLEAAQKSNTGAYAVTEQHSAIASQCVEAAKKILSKENPSEAELQTVEDIFNKLNQNPMLAEAFVTESNKTTLSTSTGKTTTLLGRYEEILTKTQGSTVAKEKIKEIKGNFSQNLSGRNSDLVSKFNEKSDSDSAKIEYSTFDKVMHKASKHPIVAGLVGLAAGGAASAGIGALAIGAASVVGITISAPALLVGAGIIAAGVGIYALGKGIVDMVSEKA